MEDSQKFRMFKAFWLTAAIIFWYYAANLMIAMAIEMRLEDTERSNAYINSHQSLLMVVTYLIVFFGVWAFDHHHESFLEVFRQWRFKEVPRYILMGIGVYIVSTVITTILLPIFPEYKELADQIDTKQVVLSFIGTAILPPIVEEYLFRHKIQGYLKDGFGIAPAIIGQAILFGILHYYAIQKIYAILIGCFFGWITHKKGSVRYSIIMHMTVNIIGWGLTWFLV